MIPFGSIRNSALQWTPQRAVYPTTLSIPESGTQSLVQDTVCVCSLFIEIGHNRDVHIAKTALLKTQSWCDMCAHALCVAGLSMPND
jgi:hypothetical protein